MFFFEVVYVDVVYVLFGVWGVFYFLFLCLFNLDLFIFVLVLILVRLVVFG